LKRAMNDINKQENKLKQMLKSVIQRARKHEVMSTKNKRDELERSL
jgi:hypothetical protein